MRFTPKKTLEVIVKNQNHYVAQVKANQRKLLAHIQQTVATQPALSQFATHQQAHGRQSSWQVAVYAALPTTLTQPWLGLSHFVHVHRHRLVKGQLSQADAYFMSDLGLDAAAFAQGIRGHWGIENKLHWVKDVVCGEDTNRIRHKRGAVNVAVLGTIALNLHRQAGHDSITEGQIKFGSNVNELTKLIRT
ncbi:ISAs1 family transposase [Spirosoma sp. KCTC 42546]|nr:ISAs1 family transposase [Spirosoma sp. KCTC 42546]QDK82142.1 ISAs1 family transposase [Spirosoma sp. KCTC 42546]